MSNKTQLQANNEKYASLIEVLRGKAVGGVELPELDNPASASDILSGKEAIDGSGNKIIGTIATQAAKTVTPTTSSQTAVASGVYTTGAVTVGPIPSNYEDVGTETTEYTSLASQLEAAINSLPEAGTGGGGSALETVAVTFPGVPAPGSMIYYVDSMLFLHEEEITKNGVYGVLKGSLVLVTYYPSDEFYGYSKIAGNDTYSLFFIS
jgi:hypothetical protein